MYRTVRRFYTQRSNKSYVHRTVFFLRREKIHRVRVCERFAFEKSILIVYKNELNAREQYYCSLSTEEGEGIIKYLLSNASIALTDFYCHIISAGAERTYA
jgi:hypothetical protein